MYQHHIRELQTLQEQLGNQLVSLRAELNQMRKRSEEQQALVAQQDAEVDKLLQLGLQDEALAAQDRLEPESDGGGVVGRARRAAGSRIQADGRH